MHCKQDLPLAEFIYHTKHNERIVPHARCYKCYKQIRRDKDPNPEARFE